MRLSTIICFLLLLAPCVSAVDYTLQNKASPAYNLTNGNATYNTSGRYFSFNGVNNWQNTTNPGVYSLNGTDFTVVVKASTARQNKVTRLIILGDATTFSWMLSPDAGGDNMRALINNRSTNLSIADPVTFSLNTDYSWAMTYALGTGNLTLWRNGVYAASGVATGGAINVSKDLAIGHEVGGVNTNAWNGTVKESWIFNRVLSPAELVRLNSGAVTGSNARTAWWDYTNLSQGHCGTGNTTVAVVRQNWTVNDNCEYFNETLNINASYIRVRGANLTIRGSTVRV